MSETPQTPKTTPRPYRAITNNELGPWVLNYHRSFYPTPMSFFIAYLISREFYNHKKGYAFPSIDFLSKVLGLSPRMMKYHIKALREATNDQGEPLWNIVRGHQTSDGSNSANRYYPLFLDEIRQGKPPVGDSAELDASFVTNEDATEENDGAVEESVETEPVEAESVEATPAEAGSNAGSDKGKYTAETLPSYVPSKVTELKNRTFGMVSYGLPNTGLDGFTEDQKETMKLILDYCANTKDLPETKRKDFADMMKKTWRAYPEMDAQDFYRRFMVYVLNQLHAEGVNTEVEQDFDAREKGMRLAEAMGVSYP